MSKGRITAVAFGVLLAIFAPRAWDMARERGRVVQSAESRADNLALILSAYIGESFQAADASLRQLQFHSQRIGGARASDNEWAPSLISARTGLTGVGAISVVDAAGIIQHSTRPEIVGQSRRNEYLTQQIISASDNDLVVSLPFRTLAGPDAPSQLTIPIGRRLSRPDGTYDGSVVASFRPDAPRSLLRDVNLGARGTITVFHPEGVVLYREPAEIDSTGQSARDNPLFLAARRSTGTLEMPLEPGGPVMLTVVRTTQTPPLIVAVSMDRADVLAGWRRNAYQALLMLTVGSLLLAGVLVILFRQMDARTEIEKAFVAATHRERERLRDANERLATSLGRERAARAEAEAASALKDEFLMTVSHELRTPLSAIYGWARLLNRGGVAERQRVMALRTIERNAEAQTHLIEDLLDASGVLMGKMRLDVRPTDMADIIQSAVQTVTPAADAKAIQLESAIKTEAFVSGDPARLQQIVWNLLSNAVKFTPTGGSVRIVVERIDADVAVRVTDSGVGISREFLPHVFDRFRQEESGTKRRFGGLGLGLAIVRSLVELHGGVVSADSAGPNLGSTFIVRFPALTVSALERHRLMSSSAPAPVRLEGVHVLLVDDDREARELFEVALTTAGASVTSAGSAGEALVRVREHAFDVLVSDIEMPGADGYVLGREAITRARERGSPLVAIAVTAYSRPEDEARSLAAGFVRHLSKPIDPADLVAAVADVVGDRRSQPRASENNL